MPTLSNTSQSQELSTDIHVITAEINAYKRIAGEAIFEIGRRLKYVREKIFQENGHHSGKWSEWLRTVEFDITTAKRFIKIFDEFSNKGDTWHHLGMRVLYEIATLPPEQREQSHTIPSTGAVKTVDEMTVRELREVKKALREAEARAEKAEQDYEVVRETLESIEEQPPRIEVRTEYVRDEQVEEELRKYRERFGNLEIYDEHISRITAEKDVLGMALLFSKDVRELIKKYSFLSHFKKEFDSTTETARKEYSNALLALNDFIGSLSSSVSGYARTDATIDVEYSIY
ncbi:DUF3102 domain-containing protein [Paenibacillus sp. ACRRX]|uniref:DUF3102 domain-containing protein n=1 Tax=Paenibacillus sp. ACRRX TaxID=2918206 RepID=UPI001EF5CC6E|nr:DUF3102 domain-containing protein [Paenibacillus sp. ACRRX]MCG7407745.1 DUF3102 domain-containing protein [Paenibacillus sp. ACRRX]